MSNFEIVITNLPNAQLPIAKIYCDKICWIQISQEEGKFMSAFYPHPSKKYWSFSFEEAFQSIEKAKDILTNMGKFEITIATLPDRERPVAEVYYNNMYWVEISEEINEPIIQFYSHPQDPFWEFKFDDALEALKKGKKLLLNDYRD